MVITKSLIRHSRMRFAIGKSSFKVINRLTPKGKGI